MHALRPGVALLPVFLMPSACAGKCQDLTGSRFETLDVIAAAENEGEVLIEDGGVLVTGTDVRVTLRDAFVDAGWGEDFSGKVHLAITNPYVDEFDYCAFSLQESYIIGVKELAYRHRRFSVFVDGAEAKQFCKAQFDASRQTWIDDGREPPEGLGAWVEDASFPTIAFTAEIRATTETYPDEECLEGL